MEQGRKSDYQKEREYQRRKSEIAARRRKSLTKQAVVLVLVLAFIALVLGDYFLDQTRMAHRLSVYGVSVSGMTVENAAQKLETAFASTQLIFTENGGEVYSTTLGAAGFSLDAEALREELQEKQADLLKSRGLIEKSKILRLNILCSLMNRLFQTHFLRNILKWNWSGRHLLRLISNTTVRLANL